MRILSALLFLLFIGAIVWSALPADSIAATPSYRSTFASLPVFLQQGAATQAPAAPPAGPPQRLGGLGSSVFPTQDNFCSTSVSGVTCSADANTPAPGQCSVRCDTNGRCSVLSAGPGDQACSTLGGNQTACSVLLDPGNGGRAAYCSIFSGGHDQNEKITCSVEASGYRQFCSSVNPSNEAGNGNLCSALLGDTSDNFQCSVLKSGTLFANHCSTAMPANGAGDPKLCSAVSGQNAQCSIRSATRGACTTLKQAPIGSCSILFNFPGGTEHCSTINGGGPNLNGICRP